LQGYPKRTQITIFGLKINHLATLGETNLEPGLLPKRFGTPSISYPKKTEDQESWK
jgi:hypothetical protein